MLTVYKQITIKTLIKQGERQAAIARQIGCHRNTVRNVLLRPGVIEKQVRRKPSYLDPDRHRIKEWLNQGVTRRRIHELLAPESKTTPSYDTLCKYIQKEFPKQPIAYGVQVTGPGEEAEIDFGYLGLLPNDDGRPVKAWGLAVILSFSRLGYWVVTYDQKLDTLVKHLKLAFEYFGGVPARLKVDNMRSAILKNQHYQLEYNQDFLEFAYHYGTVIAACAPYHPEQKGKVEAGIKYLKVNFVNGRRFQDGRHLANSLRDWVDNYANRRIHGTTKKVPREVFLSAEKLKLQPLPTEEFTLFQRGIRRVAANSHIHFGNNYYSVPSRLVGKEVTVRYTDHLLRIIYQGDQIALHRLSGEKGEYITVRNHLPDYKSYSQTEYQARYEEKMAVIGKHALAYFQLLLKVKGGYWSRTVRGILGLAVEYGEAAVELSLARALYYQATDLAAVKSIVQNRLYLSEPEPRLPVDSIAAGGSLAHPDGLSRDLSYYMLP